MPPSFMCPLCFSQLKPGPRTQRLSIQRCTGCGHAVAEHVRSPATESDYHLQYDAGSFLESLQQTRERQAKEILRSLQRLMPSADRLLDFGAGRGWFLDACRAAGMRDVAAADTSELAVRSAAERGFEALQLPADGTLQEGWAKPLRFQPRILSLLDVVEHFPPEELVSRVSLLIGALRPALEWVVMKVPISGGLLYRASLGAARMGAHGPLEQLYQAGTWPPHFNYFSVRSAEALLTKVGLRLAERWGDPDFEPDSFAARVHVLRQMPRFIQRAVGATLGMVIRVLPFRDSVVFLART